MSKSKNHGFYGWWLLFFLFLVYFPIGVSLYGVAVLFPAMIEATGWSRAQINIGLTMIYLVLGFGAPLVAWFVNKFNVKWTLVAGSGAMAITTAITGFIGDIYIAYLILCGLLGLFMGFVVQIPMQTVIIRWFVKRRALALGLVMGSGAVAGFIGPQIITLIVTTSANNWHLGWYVMTGFSLVSMVIALIKVRNSPEDLKQYPDGISPEQSTSATTATSEKQVSLVYTAKEDWTLAEAVQTPTLWLFIVANILAFFLWMIIQTQGPLHLTDRGFDPTLTSFIYSLAIGLSLIGRFTFAGLGDKIEPRYLFAAAVLLVIFSGFLFWAVTPEAIWMAYLYPVLGGFGFGIMSVCFAGILSNYYGQKAFPAVMGLAMMFESITSSFAATLAGLVYDAQGNYFTVMLIALIAAALGFICIILAAPPQKPVVKN